MTYQGWANAQTWCVAAYIDNDRELLPKAIHYGKTGTKRPCAFELVRGFQICALGVGAKDHQ